jgi:hypothetical protein
MERKSKNTKTSNTKTPSTEGGSTPASIESDPDETAGFHHAARRRGDGNSS